MRLLKRIRHWRARRRQMKLLRYMWKNRVVWDAAIQRDPRNTMDYFRRSITP